MIALTVACGLACAVLVYAEWRQHAVTRAVAKTIASLAFVGVGVLAATDTPYARWIIVGLALGVVGDLALLGRAKRAFIAGLIAFLFGHLAYVVAMAQVVAPARWLASAQFTALVPVAIAALAIAKLWPHVGALRVPVIAYVLAIVVMVIGAFAVMHAGALPYESRYRLAVGAVLFFVSDLAVARDKFLVQSIANRAFGLPAYYAGQLLIAWSV